MNKHTDFLHKHNARHVFHPMGHPAEIQNNPPIIVSKGDGVHIEDESGHRAIDAVGGLWNVNLGYSCEPVKAAIRAQLDELPYYAAFRGTTTPGVIELSERLIKLTEQENMKRAFFCSGGSDAVETALRLARQYWKVEGQKDRYKFISFQKGYHGTHFGGGSVNGGDRFRRNYEPGLPGCLHTPFPDTYRNPFGISDPTELAGICLNVIEQTILNQGPDTIAAFIAEPVMGAGGVYPPPDNLWPGLRALCDKYEILLIADEVITGFGRSGSWFGCRNWNVAPDIMCIAKAITTGYFPFGATLLNERIEQSFMNDTTGTGGIYHGYTYSGHPVGCAAALATLDETYRHDLPANSLARGGQIMQRLRSLQDSVSSIGEVRGKGLMVAVDLVTDRDTRTPAPPEMGAKVAEIAFKEGALVRVSGNNLIISPPLILTEQEADSICDALETGLRAI